MNIPFHPIPDLLPHCVLVSIGEMLVSARCVVLSCCFRAANQARGIMELCRVLWQPLEQVDASDISSLPLAGLPVPPSSIVPHAWWQHLGALRPVQAFSGLVLTKAGIHMGSRLFRGFPAVSAEACGELLTDWKQIEKSPVSVTYSI